MQTRMLRGGCFLCLLLVTAAGPEERTRSRRSNEQTEIIILGTLHEFHDQCPLYSRDILRDIIISVRPALVLYEMPAMLDGQPTLVDGRIDARFHDNESVAANQAADSLDIRLAPYDIEGRNEFYAETRYFEREERTFQDLRQWGDQSAGETEKSLRTIVTSDLFNSIQQAQIDLVMRSGPTVINSPAFDSIVRSKHCIVYEVWRQLLLADGEEFLAGELGFFKQEWDSRNRAMASNIENIAKEHRGARIVVLCGAEHRNELTGLLRRGEHLEVREYYEVE